jgi:chemotaxis protein MotA
MIGTVIGLVQMLQSMDDPSSIGPSMAVALITTFYGAILSNLIFNPMAGKLKTRSKEEVLLREMMLEGILSISKGENPRIVEEKLNSFLPPKLRKVSE